MAQQVFTLSGLDIPVLLKPNPSFLAAAALVEFINFPNGSCGQFGGSRYPIYLDDIRIMNGLHYSLSSKIKLDAVRSIVLLKGGTGVRVACSNPAVLVKVTLSDDITLPVAIVPTFLSVAHPSFTNLVNMQTFPFSGFTCYQVNGVANTVGSIEFIMPNNFAKGNYNLVITGYAQGASGVPFTASRNNGLLSTANLPSSGTAAWSHSVDSVALEAGNTLKLSMKATGNNKGCLRSMTLAPV